MMYPFVKYSDGAEVVFRMLEKKKIKKNIYGYALKGQLLKDIFELYCMQYNST